MELTPEAVFCSSDSPPLLWRQRQPQFLHILGGLVRWVPVPQPHHLPVPHSWQPNTPGLYPTAAWSHSAVQPQGDSGPLSSSQLLNSMAPSHVGRFLRRPNVVDSDTELCVMFSNYDQTPQFLETVSPEYSSLIRIIEIVVPVMKTQGRATKSEGGLLERPCLKWKTFSVRDPVYWWGKVGAKLRQSARSALPPSLAYVHHFGWWPREQAAEMGVLGRVGSSATQEDPEHVGETISPSPAIIVLVGGEPAETAAASATWLGLNGRIRR